MPVLSILQGTGTVLRDESDRKIQYDKSNLKGYKVMNKGDFIIHLRTFEGGLECSNHDGISSPAYRILRPKEIISGAYRDYFRSPHFIKNKLAISVVGIRDGKNIDMPTFWDIMLTVPSIDEQQKIAEFLSDVDELINASEDEITNLEMQKKAAMKKIFSQEVRFKKPDGSEFPKWERKTIGECCDILDNMRKPVTKSDRRPGIYPYYGSTNIQDYVDDYIFDEPLVLLAEDAGPFDDYWNKPVAQWAEGKFWVNNHAHVLRPHHNRKYIFYTLEHKDIREYIKNPGRGKLNQEDMRSISLPIPDNEEQRLIADFLSSFDEAINAAKEELTKYRELKKGLLQQMFI